ncbi:GMC family oxidoreductase [Aspergillus glaucus CBS 516.65]|uniref:Glucose-methanol-choline oxidoreductase N-terminal domain-containing protein n=1 Tax=Aspergillus glaucus CBS 516.65 TaxID=1160497 RepID=A0A1L9VMU4_ASPGL|nr:hypothetical protein ASPGLDRAFT_1515688 [Aspergillus glaucus CBS 516.65]OJJ85246.1 hypothetical protein ASPGLDRAFT_1515688 [Aspergillus glaucus CBS 516.65]
MPAFQDLHCLRLKFCGISLDSREVRKTAGRSQVNGESSSIRYSQLPYMDWTIARQIQVLTVVVIIIFQRLLGLAAISIDLAQATNLTGYEYVVVGSGADGNPLATRLALGSHKTLLIEAGDDQRLTYNYSIPVYLARSSEDEALAWNFARHYVGYERQARDSKTTYQTPDGEEYTDLSPPGNFLSPETAPLSLVLKDSQLLSMLTSGAFALGNLTDSIMNYGTLLLGDANADTRSRDTEPGYYQIPVSTDDAHRNVAREFIVAVRDAENEVGSQKYPLDVRMNCHVTKVTFDESKSPPRATGIEFLDGQYLYKASPRSKTASSGTPGSAKASREVIVAGGAYNSPQFLKLNGVGPAKELNKFDIPVISDLPGTHSPNNFTCLDGCTFNIYDCDDPCINRWESPVLGDRGIYSSPGLAATMFYKSTVSADDSFDIFAFGGPVNFRDYFPYYSINATHGHGWFTWAILKAHPRSHTGTVTPRSSAPLDAPDITFNYFNMGVGDHEANLQPFYEAVELARDAFDRQTVEVTEVLPGKDITSKEDIQDYVKDSAWEYHASCTCPIGADDDPMVVLNSKFQVRGVSGLRVVDASVYPQIPGTFTAVSTYMVAEKAADIILGKL